MNQRLSRLDDDYHHDLHEYKPSSTIRLTPRDRVEQQEISIHLRASAIGPSRKFGPPEEPVSTDVLACYAACEARLHDYHGVYALVIVGLFIRPFSWAVDTDFGFSKNVVCVIAEEQEEVKALLWEQSCLLVLPSEIRLGHESSMMRRYTYMPTIGNSIGLLGQAHGSATLCCYVSTGTQQYALTIGHLVRGITDDTVLVSPSPEDLEAQLEGLKARLNTARRFIAEKELLGESAVFRKSSAEELVAEIDRLPKGSQVIGPRRAWRCEATAGVMTDYALFECSHTLYDNFVCQKPSTISQTYIDLAPSEKREVCKVGRTSDKSKGVAFGRPGIFNLAGFGKIKSLYAMFRPGGFVSGDAGSMLYTSDDTAAYPVGMCFASASTCEFGIALYQPMSKVLDEASRALGQSLHIYDSA